MAVWRGPYPFDGDSHESTLALQDCFPSPDIRCAPTIFILVLSIGLDHRRVLPCWRLRASWTARL